MKSLLTLLVGLLISINVLSQEIEYPRYELDSLGQSVVVMTIEQAQKLDNNSDLLQLFEQLNVQIGSYDSVCVKAVNDKNIVISEQKVLIEQLNTSIDTKDTTIETLQKQVTEYQLREVMFNDQLINLKDQIDLKDKQIREMKTKMIIGGGLGGLAIVGLIISILLP
jgi:predicted RNase H-like nuclease (RuvC/YqgF family)